MPNKHNNRENNYKHTSKSAHCAKCNCSTITSALCADLIFSELRATRGKKRNSVAFPLAPLSGQSLVFRVHKSTTCGLLPQGWFVYTKAQLAKHLRKYNYLIKSSNNDGSLILLHNQKKETQINTKIQLLTRGKNLLKRTSPSPLQRGFCFAFLCSFSLSFFFFRQ